MFDIIITIVGSIIIITGMYMLLKEASDNEPQ